MKSAPHLIIDATVVADTPYFVSRAIFLPSLGKDKLQHLISHEPLGWTWARGPARKCAFLSAPTLHYLSRTRTCMLSPPRRSDANLRNLIRLKPGSVAQCVLWIIINPLMSNIQVISKPHRVNISRMGSQFMCDIQFNPRFEYLGHNDLLMQSRMHAFGHLRAIAWNYSRLVLRVNTNMHVLHFSIDCFVPFPWFLRLMHQCSVLPLSRTHKFTWKLLTRQIRYYYYYYYYYY